MDESQIYAIGQQDFSVLREDGAPYVDKTTFIEKLVGSNTKYYFFRITDDMITTMAVACDIEVPDGDLEERYLGLKSCLLTLERFECNRLR